jgi:hypothetical protein
MFRKLALVLFFVVALTCPHLKALACGHEGPFVGIGYNQLFMYTPQKQYMNTSSRISFSPGYGGNLTFGYDFQGTRWGIQIPAEYARIKLNGNEWVNSIQASAEGIFRIKQWDNGVDFHLVGGFGWSYLSEGKVYNRSQSNGITGGIGPGVSYFFSMTEKISGAVVAEVPIRAVYFVSGHLSSGKAVALDVPIRISMQIGF